MDGNGRWAAARGLPRHAGHRAGIGPVRMVIEECSRRGVQALTLFAFSSENWGRPSVEVSGIMNLFLDSLQRETAQLHANRVRVRFVGERRTLPVRLQALVAATQAQTAGNEGLRLQLAVSYGGRWDIVQANQRLAEQCLVGALNPRDITEERRREITKVVRHDAEGARVAVRNVRRDVMSDIKDLLKEKLISQDDERRAETEVQKLTDKYVAEIDQVLAAKEKEIMQV